MKKFAIFAKKVYFCIPFQKQGRSSVGSERLSHIQEVIGSTPIVPTTGRQHLLVAFLFQQQPEAVADHQHGTAGHRGGGDHRVEHEAEGAGKHTRGYGNGDHIVEEGPEQVLVDIPEGGPAQADRRRDVREAAFHHDDVRRVYGHVGARADGDAHVRAGERRGVVDPVADHGDTVPGGLQGLDVGDLILRQGVGADVGDAGLTRDGGG